jgi:hypothetical protein
MSKIGSSNYVFNDASLSDDDDDDDDDYDTLKMFQILQLYEMKHKAFYKNFK